MKFLPTDCSGYTALGGVVSGDINAGREPAESLSNLHLLPTYQRREASWTLSAPTAQCMFKINDSPTLRLLQAQLLPFIERLEKGLFTNRFSCRSFFKMHGRIRCSILQNMKMPWRPLLFALEATAAFPRVQRWEFSQKMPG